ncbi:MAG: DNA-3-methyladenine glycosylase I [Candidatus Bathyarchaeia archaeon]
MDGEHRAPWECIYPKEDKSICKPGMKPKSDIECFEILCLCILQAGLSWGAIRKNWEKYRLGFYGFDFNVLANKRLEELLKRPGVIKNKKKIEAIIYNAEKFQRIRRDYGSFSNFLESLRRLKDEEALKALMKQFKHVGAYTAEYYLHCVGYW